MLPYVDFLFALFDLKFGSNWAQIGLFAEIIGWKFALFLLGRSVRSQLNIPSITSKYLFFKSASPWNMCDKSGIGRSIHSFTLGELAVMKFSEMHVFSTYSAMEIENITNTSKSTSLQAIREIKLPFTSKRIQNCHNSGWF